MSENLKVLKNFKKDVEYRLRPFSDKKGKVILYEKLASRLSKLVHKEPAWSWRYVQGVYQGTIAPSKKFVLAVDRFISPMKEHPEPATQEWWERVAKQGVRVMVRLMKKSVLSKRLQ